MNQPRNGEPTLASIPGQRRGRARLEPLSPSERDLSWFDADLHDMDGPPNPDDVAFDYVNPTTGGHVLPTIGCRIQMLRKGEKLKARRVTGSSVFHVVQGKGRSVIEGKTFDWAKGDIIALPSWAEHAHSNTGTEDAILFSISDRPVIEALGFYREQV